MGRATWGMALVLSAGMMFGVVVRAEAQVPRGLAGVHVPPGHRPGPGQCRVWYPGVPPGHQPAAFACDAPRAYHRGGVVALAGPWGREAFLLVGEVRPFRRVRRDFTPIRFRLAATGGRADFQWVAELGYTDFGRNRDRDFDRFFRVDDRRRDKPGRGRGRGRRGR
ncbi:MAG: hypothetical protein PVJ80_15165 [Gemmatimonadota bacterium]